MELTRQTLNIRQWHSLQFESLELADKLSNLLTGPGQIHSYTSKAYFNVHLHEMNNGYIVVSSAY